MEGMLPIDGVGLFIGGGAFWSGGCVPTLEVDMLRAGDAGRAAAVNGEGEGAGGGAIVPLVGGLEGWRDMAAADAAVGVACGVEAADAFAFATEIGVGVCLEAPAGG